jgi:hypothetical protein
MLHLPGPSEFVRAVTTDLDAGASVVLVFPQTMIAAGTARHILDRVANGALATVIEPGTAHLADRTAHALNLSTDWEPELDPWYDLAHWAPGAGHVVAIPGWDEDLTDLLPRWEHLQHEIGGEAPERLRLIIGTDRTTIEQARLDRTQTLHLRIHWWWGVIDRLDTNLYLRTTRPGRPDPLQHALLMELVAWDLPLADALSDSDPADLRQHLPRTIPHRARSADLLPPPVRGAQAAPPASVRNAWDAGCLELWEGRYRPQLSAEIFEEVLPRLTWRAQARVLFPHLEEQRAQLEEKFLRAAPAHLHDPTTRSTDLWELGTMWYHVRCGTVRLNTEDRRLLKAARRVRNQLAHLEPASPEDLAVLLPIESR